MLMYVCVFVRPFSGKYLYNKAEGSYTCVVCGAVLFLSCDKFESGCGWPAFSSVLSSAAVKLTPDHSHGLSIYTVVTVVITIVRVAKNPGSGGFVFLGFYVKLVFVKGSNFMICTGSWLVG